jgi:predicted dehydrogenase
MGQKAHLCHYVDRDDCDVVAIAEPRAETAQLVAGRYGIPRIYPDHRAMLAAEQLDGVVASQPFAHHATLLPELYPQVRHILTEKPLAIEAGAGARLAEAAAANDCTHMVAYHKRCDPATRAAKATIDRLKASRELGPLQYVRIQMPSGDWIANGFDGLLSAGDRVAGTMPQEVPSGMFTGASYDSYVHFVNYYIHQVNLMRHLLGEDYTVRYADPSGVLLACASKSGIPGVIEMTPYQTTRAWEEEALIAFATINQAGTVEVYADPDRATEPTRTVPTLPWRSAMQEQAATFIAVCRGDQEPPCDAASAVKDLQTAAEYITLLEATR